MRHSILGKQNNSRMCFVCGLSNESGLKASFFETEAGEVVALVRPSEHHQGYPGRMHGGVAAAILDETIGRAAAIGKGGQFWGLTVELSTKYRKPIPLGEELRIVGRVTKDGSRFFEGSGEILLADGTVAVSAVGRYIKIPIEKIIEGGMGPEEWALAPDPSDPESIDLPGEGRGE